MRFALIVLIALPLFGQAPVPGGTGSGGGSGGLSSLPVSVDGGAPISATSLNFSSTSGMAVTETNVGGAVTVIPTIQSSIWGSRVIEQSGTDNSCVSASGSATAYTCNLTTTLTAYVDQMPMRWKPDMSCTGSVSTFMAVDSLPTPRRIFANNGTSDPTAAQCPFGSQLDLLYDASLNASAGAWRIMSAGAVPTILPVASGGTGTASTLTGLVRGSSSAMTAAELSGDVTTSGSNATVLATKYKTALCEPGLGDGLNAIAAATYLQSTCVMKFGATVTITGIWCFTDNSGTSTLAVTNGANTALLTGAVTCSAASILGAAGTQSATTTIADADGLKFTFVADGTSKQTNWVVAFTR